MLQYTRAREGRVNVFLRAPPVDFDPAKAHSYYPMFDTKDIPTKGLLFIGSYILGDISQSQFTDSEYIAFARKFNDVHTSLASFLTKPFYRCVLRPLPADPHDVGYILPKSNELLGTPDEDGWRPLHVLFETTPHRHRVEVRIGDDPHYIPFDRYLSDFVNQWDNWKGNLLGHDALGGIVGMSEETLLTANQVKLMYREALYEVARVTVASAYRFKRLNVISESKMTIGALEVGYINTATEDDEDSEEKPTEEVEEEDEDNAEEESEVEEEDEWVDNDESAEESAEEVEQDEESAEEEDGMDCTIDVPEKGNLRRDGLFNLGKLLRHCPMPSGNRLFDVNVQHFLRSAVNTIYPSMEYPGRRKELNLDDETCRELFHRTVITAFAFNLTGRVERLMDYFDAVDGGEYRENDCRLLFLDELPRFLRYICSTLSKRTKKR